jgi:hypothetical protein
LKPARIVGNLVGLMLSVQVILGGSAVFGYVDVRYHLVWGVLAFGVLIIATVYAASELGRKSTLFRTGIAAIADYVIQIILGFIALGTNSARLLWFILRTRFCSGSSLPTSSVSPTAQRRHRHLSIQRVPPWHRERCKLFPGTRRLRITFCYHL